MLRANPSFVRDQGFETEQELLDAFSTGVSDIYVQANRRQAFTEALEGHGQVTDFVSEIHVKKTGQTMWVREHAHVVYRDDGEIHCYEGTIENINAERATEASLAAQAQRFRALTDSAQLLTLICNLQGQLSYVSGASMHLLARHQEQLLDTHLTDWAHPQDVDILQAELDRVAGGEDSQLEVNLRLAHHDGSWRHVGMLMRNCLTERGIEGLVCNFRDTSLRVRAEAKLREANEWLELAILGADLGTWEQTVGGERKHQMDERACAMLGLSVEQFQGVDWPTLIHPDDLPVMRQRMRDHRDGLTSSFDAEYRAKHKNGSWVWFYSRGKLQTAAHGNLVTRLVGTVMDISVRKSAEEALRATEADLRATLAALPDPVFELDVNGTYLAAHSQRSDTLTNAGDSLVGKRMIDVLPVEAATQCMAALQQALANGHSSGTQYRLMLSNGEAWFELSVARKSGLPDQPARFIAIARDISERKRATEAVRQMAFHDPLTELPNRRLLMDRLQHALAVSARNRIVGSVLFLDLDNFKTLNDAHGHDVGDLLLREVARRLLHCVRAADTVARMGGDEFVVLLEDLSFDLLEAQTQTLNIANKILIALNQPYQLGHITHRSTPSIGAALMSATPTSASELLKQADVAMYQAKSKGRNQVVLLSPQDMAIPPTGTGNVPTGGRASAGERLR